MTETPRYANAGGFIPPSLPSPAPSTASTKVAARLPHPRSKPLVAGSRKEDYARNYVSQRLMHISRRFVKKHGIPDPADEVTGYESMDEVCRDMEEVVDVLWFSGTPSLQIPYFLNVALAFNTYLSSFPPSPRPTFALLNKLDHCFASLLIGHDVKTQGPLPGFQRGLSAGFSKTEMVRCKSLADETRMLVAVVMSGENDVETYASDEEEVVVPAMRKVMTSPRPSNGIETVKVEEMEADEDSDASEGEGTTAPIKRKVDEASLEDEAEDRKRVKIEEEDDERPVFSDAAETDEGGAPAHGTSSNGQFHFSVEDDSDDEALPNTNGLSRVEQTTDAEDEFDDARSEVDEEEEELHLNVAKVYEKTLTQLGQSLGESIIDD